MAVALAMAGDCSVLCLLLRSVVGLIESFLDLLEVLLRKNTNVWLLDVDRVDRRTPVLDPRGWLHVVSHPG